jgi:arylformamidase
MKYSTEFCDREYNARAGIPDHPAIFARWSASGAQARRDACPLLDLRYGSSPGERLDLFPASHGGAPLLVFIHGGFWRSLDKGDFSWVAPPFVDRGVGLALINYDLAPSVGVETIVLQVLRALEWLWRGAERYRYDASRIVVAGHSAGGHLAAMAMCVRWPLWDPDMPVDLVKGGVSVSGLYDLEPLVYAPFVNQDLKLDERSAFRLSPAWMTPATGAPLVTAVGALESSEFHRQNELIGRQWSRNLRADVPMPGTNHLTVADQLANPASPLFQAALDLCLG